MANSYEKYVRIACVDEKSAKAIANAIYEEELESLQKGYWRTDRKDEEWNMKAREMNKIILETYIKGDDVTVDKHYTICKPQAAIMPDGTHVVNYETFSVDVTYLIQLFNNQGASGIYVTDLSSGNYFYQQAKKKYNGEHYRDKDAAEKAGVDDHCYYEWEIKVGEEG